MTARRPIQRLLLLSALAVAAGWTFLSCEMLLGTDPETSQDERETTLSLTTGVSDCTAGDGWVAVQASGHWTLAIDGDPSWASLSTYSGLGNKSTVSMHWDANPDRGDRSCTVVLVTSRDTVRSVFVQYGTATEIVQDPVRAYMELPEITDGSLYFFSHPMISDGKVTRNFSYLYDKDARVARWVAYPLNNRLKSGSCGRSENWGEFDPKFPAKYQPYLKTPYSGYGVRGHQIPSADRQISQYNEQTFYGTNMTPQNYDLNGGLWSELEAYVRNRCGNFDTLYVVTGCIIGGSSRKAYDNNGRSVSVPTHYFKALLGYSRKGTVGRTAATGGYTAIGFYLPNEDCSGTVTGRAMTVRELETKTGINFFCNLPAAIGGTLADNVETTKDNWWYK